MCSVIESTTFKELFHSERFNLRKLLYSSLPNNTIADRIKMLRFSLDISQLEFAKSLNKSFSTITKWEQGLVEPPKRVLNIIVKLYNLPKDYFDIK